MDHMDQETVKLWLKEFHHSRTWLATQCNAAPQTINNWLSTSRGIPKHAELLIERLMEADRLRATDGALLKNTLTLEFNPEDFDMIEQAARLKNMKIRHWAAQTLRQIAQRDTREVLKELMVAEKENKYHSSK